VQDLSNLERRLPMPRRPASIAIAGGGIGGLTAALCLLKAGFDVHVFERAKTLREGGAGVVISPNAARVLHHLGLNDELRSLGVQPAAWHQRRWEDGHTLLRTPLAEAAIDAFGFPHYLCHRGDVLTMLAAALPPERLHVGCRLNALTDRGDRVEARFENGTKVVADILVGADGIHSTVRHLVFGPDNPRFTGCVSYRGLVPARDVKHLNLEATLQIWMGPGKHFVHYFVRREQLLNFVCHVEQESWTKESWTDRGDIADVRTAYKNWHPQVGGILDSASEIFVLALFDRAPLPRWSSGRVTLLGDACHPMLPFMAQGAAQAIEDGATLASVFAGSDSLSAVEALREYERLRLPRTSRIQALAADNKIRFHLPDGPAQRERDAQMASGSTDWSKSAIAWIYSHDAGAVELAG
jgi:salicylate hydroxylase